MLLAVLDVVVMLQEYGAKDETFFKTIVGLLFILALIWLAEPLSKYCGPSGRGAYIDKRSPRWMVAALGWTLLLVISWFILRSHLS